jgi:hypothetical protein
VHPFDVFGLPAECGSLINGSFFFEGAKVELWRRTVRIILRMTGVGARKMKSHSYKLTKGDWGDQNMTG